MALFGGTSSDPQPQGDLAAATSEAVSGKRNAMELDQSLSRMTLVCAALWELVKERTNLSEEDLQNKIAEMDAKDGVLDGRFTPMPRYCVKCQRTIQINQNTCMYCGVVQPPDTLSVFESI